MGNNGSNYGNHNQMFDSMMPEQFIGEMKDNHRNGKGTFIYSNGDRYEGNWLNDLRHGKGTFYYKTGELYIGEWKNNEKEGFGKLFYQNGERYLGYWANNMKEGEGTLHMVDGSYFKGAYHENQKHGKAESHMANGDVYLEEWENNLLISQTQLITIEDNLHSSQKLEKKSGKEKTENKSNELNPTQIEENVDENKKTEIDQIKEVSKEYEENLTSEAKINDDQNEGNLRPNLFETENNIGDLESQLLNTKYESIAEKDLLSEMKSELKTLDGGFDTLALIEQIEMFNSLNSCFLNKNIQDWNTEDVAEWLTIIGLTEYADNFTQNHINGKILFDLTEKEVKEDLQIISIGHRKNFHKAVQHLKKFYSKNRLYSDSIKNKLIKFYEKHSQQLKIGKKNFSFFDIKNDIIHEDNDEISYKESPAVMNIKHETNNNNNIIEGEDFQLDIYEEDAVLHFNEKLVKSKSKKKKNFITGKKFDDEDVPNSRKLSPVFSKESDSKSVKTLEEIKDDEENAQNINKPDIYINIEETLPIKTLETNGSIKLDANLSVIKEESIANIDANQEVAQEKKPIIINEESLSSDSDSSTSEDDQQIKKTKSSKPYLEENEKSESPLPKKYSSRKNVPNKKRVKRKKIEEEIDGFQKDSMTFDQKLIMKTFKDAGIGSNFLIAYKELEMLKKVGEGGYGDVFLGKWLGQEVAIKQYGKNSKFRNTKKIADFIKEVEVISNLRHPNIVLYMGVCINYSKYLMITEYLEGGSLFDLLHKKHIPLTEDRIILIAEDIALGMNYLHGRKVLHCDLKSSNILIDSNWNIKLCDFGLSRVKSKLDKKKNAGRIGTPHWMAPEVCRGEKYDEYSDIYSYGMILWEMVSRETPFKGFSITQIIGSVGFDNYQVPIPKKGNPLILKIMEKCLSRVGENRPKFKVIVECLQNRNREKEKKNEVISELKHFFGV